MGRPVDAVAHHARLSPDRLAAHDLASGRSWTYAALDRLIGQAAAALHARGVVVGDRVAVLALNSVFQVALHHACGRLGALYTPLNWRLSAPEIEALLARAEPRILLTDTAEPSGRGVDISAFQAEVEALLPIDTGWIDPSQASLLLFTSGTSGRPKGAIITEENIRQTALNFGAATCVVRSSRFLCDAPMFHIIGLVTNVRPAFAVGGAIVVSQGFDPARTLAWLADPELAVTHYVGVPQMLESLRRQAGFRAEQLSGLTALVTGGAPYSAAHISAWLDEGVPLVSGFGMSEAGTVLGMPVEIDVIRRKLGSAGVPPPSIQTRVVDGEGRDVPAGVPGELRLRGPNVFAGYWRDPEETAKVLDPEGWFATGDIVRYDHDGFFWVVDRKKDMFISGGENIYPAEIEAVLASYPGVRECALVGVPDAAWGEVGCLVLVPGDGGVDEAALREHLAQRLARYKLPRQIVVLGSLPRTASGKVQKQQLREQLQPR